MMYTVKEKLMIDEINYFPTENRVRVDYYDDNKRIAFRKYENPSEASLERLEYISYKEGVYYTIFHYGVFGPQVVFGRE